MISGPSGVGKGTIVSRLLRRVPDLHLSVSATTRPPRPGEAHGVHYVFVTPDEFRERVEQGGFLEWADVYGRLYGTPRAAVEELVDQGRDVLLEVDIAGARQVRASSRQPQPGTRPLDTYMVFVRPPGLGELERRLRSRGTESEAQVRRRLTAARSELDAEPDFDVTVVNDDLDETVARVTALVRRARSRARNLPTG